jgi:hypothetical protein
MDVTALSSLNQSNFSQAVGVSILKMADNQSVQSIKERGNSNDESFHSAPSLYE